jgi:microcystin-dependent protein
MGNTAAGRLTATYFGTAATTLGAAGGGQSVTLVTGNLPPYTPAGSVSTSTSISRNANIKNAFNFTAGATAGALDGAATITATSTSTFTGTAQGGVSTPHPLVQPTMLATVYLKL